ncbi:MAG: GTP-binding protein [Burkholderiales bacterium]|nr:GTP-binding protein [Burkholderiales bacterium]
MSAVGARVPTTVITGFLGTGKTTAIRHLLQQRPPGEHWGVIVNEFGEIGIDSAVLAASGDGVEVRDVPGGCICCTTAPMLRVAVNRLLQGRWPHRLIIEPTGLGHPVRIVDGLRDPWMQKALDLRGVVCLVDPRQFGDPRYRDYDVYADQVMLADVLIANKSDLASSAELDAFERGAAALFPAKRVIAQTDHGRIDPAWLDCEPGPERQMRNPEAHGAGRRLQGRPPTIDAGPVAPVEPGAFVRREGSSLGRRSCGWLFARDTWFEPTHLASLFDRLGEMSTGAPQRAKGVFRIDRDWALYDWVDGRWSWEPIAWRTDSRFEVIVDGNVVETDWSALEVALLRAVVGR